MIPESRCGVQCCVENDSEFGWKALFCLRIWPSSITDFSSSLYCIVKSASAVRVAVDVVESEMKTMLELDADFLTSFVMAVCTFALSVSRNDWSNADTRDWTRCPLGVKVLPSERGLFFSSHNNEWEEKDEESTT